MKYLLILCLSFAGNMAFAQTAMTTTTSSSASTSVKETSTDDAYSFTVKVDKNQLTDLKTVYFSIADADFKGDFTGISEHSTYGKALITLNTKKRTITVVNEEKQAKSLSSARELAERVRRELGLERTPATPER